MGGETAFAGGRGGGGESKAVGKKAARVRDTPSDRVEEG